MTAIGDLRGAPGKTGGSGNDVSNRPRGAADNVSRSAFLSLVGSPFQLPFSHVFMILQELRDVTQISCRRAGTIAAVRHLVLWDELQDPLSSFVPDFSPASAGFFFGGLVCR
jgi:hypothetical protein